MKKFRAIRILGLIIILGVISYGLYTLYAMINGVTSTISKMVITNDIPNEYISLFKKDINIIDKETHFDDNRNRNQVSDFIYDDHYAVFVTKIKTRESLNSVPIIAEQLHKTKMTDNVVYSTISLGYSELNYFLDTLSASSIYLTLYGDSIKSIIKKNTVQGYFIINKESSISYKNDGVVNLFIRTTDDKYPLPSIFLFLVHQKSLYFICISALNSKNKLDIKMVNKLVDIPAE